MKKQKKIIIVAILLLTIVVSTLGYLVVNHLVPLEITGEATGYTEIYINDTSWWANYEQSQGGTENRHDKTDDLSVGKDIRLGGYEWYFISAIQFDNLESKLPQPSNQYEISNAQLILYPRTASDTSDSKNPLTEWSICKLANNNTHGYNWIDDPDILSATASWRGLDHKDQYGNSLSIWILANSKMHMIFDVTPDVQEWHTQFVTRIPSTNNGWVFKLAAGKEECDTRSEYSVKNSATVVPEDRGKLQIQWRKKLPVTVNLQLEPATFTSKSITISVQSDTGFYEDDSKQLNFLMDGWKTFSAWDGSIDNSKVHFSVDKTLIDTKWAFRWWRISGINDFGPAQHEFIMNGTDGSYTITAVYEDTSEPFSTVTINNNTGGKVVPYGTKTNQYRQGSSVVITATALEGYKFDYLTRNDKKIGTSDESTKIAQIFGPSKTSITLLSIALTEDVKVYFVKDDLLSKILGEWLPFEIAGIIALAALVIFVKRVQRKRVTQ